MRADNHELLQPLEGDRLVGGCRAQPTSDGLGQGGRRGEKGLGERPGEEARAIADGGRAPPGGVQPDLVQLAGHAATAADEVGGGLAAVEDRHRVPG